MPFSFTSSRCSRSLLRLHNRNGPRLSEIVPSRSAASKVQSPFPRNFPGKPLAIATPRRLTPPVSEFRETQANVLAEKLARDGKTMLLKVASHFGFMWSAWMAGVICFTGVYFILSTNLYELNVELPWFVPIAYRLSAIVLVAMGSFSILRSSRLLSSIEILPGKDHATLLFKIRRNIPLPFIKHRVLTAPVSDVSVERRVVVSGQSPALEPRDLGDLEKNIIIIILRRLTLAASRFVAGAKQFMFSDRIIFLHIKGHRGTWKLDSNALLPAGDHFFLRVVKFED